MTCLKMEKINLKLIQNFLTLRYNPEDKPAIPVMKSNQISNTISDSNGLKTEKLLKNSIKKRFKHVDTIAVSLSGGIDSSVSLALLRNTFPKKNIVAITGVFDGSYDESPVAKKITSNLDVKFKTVKMDSIFTTMPKIISISKKPRWNTYQHLITKEAKKYSDLLITGDAADEIFAGYVFRYKKFMNLFRPKNNWKIKTINYLECHNRDWVPDQEILFGKKINFKWNRIYDYFKPYFSNPLSPLQQVMLADFNGKLIHDFIPTSRAISRFYSCNISSIFLDSDVISFGNSLQLLDKYDSKNNRGKLVIRKIAKRLDVKHLEGKYGFSPGLYLDWKKKGKKICEKYLLNEDSYIYKQKIIDYNWIIRSFEKAENDGDIRYLNRLISILALEIWYRLFITKEFTGSKNL